MKFQYKSLSNISMQMQQTYEEFNEPQMSQVQVQELQEAMVRLNTEMQQLKIFFEEMES